MFDLTGRVALVTGAGQNLGQGIAEMLGAAGAAVAVNDLDLERASAVAELLRGRGIRATAAAFDVGDPTSVASGVAQVELDLAPVDILVNNAGIPAGMAVAPFRETSPDAWWQYFAVNALGPMHCAQAVVPKMRNRGWGRVITISSDAFTGTDIGVSVYGASKGAGVAFMRSLALEEAPSGITANTVALGPFQRAGGLSDVSEAIARRVPLRRVGTPMDLGGLCVYLSSDESGFMTGQTLFLNGGLRTT